MPRCGRDHDPTAPPVLTRPDPKLFQLWGWTDLPILVSARDPFSPLWAEVRTRRRLFPGRNGGQPRHWRSHPDRRRRGNLVPHPTGAPVAAHPVWLGRRGDRPAAVILSALAN